LQHDLLYDWKVQQGLFELLEGQGEERMNYTILYKCNRCGTLSQKLSLYCDYCGTKLINKREMKKDGDMGDS